MIDEDRLSELGAGAAVSSRLKALWSQQQRAWPLLGQAAAELSSIRWKELQAEGDAIRVQFNPARIVNTGAAVDKASIAARPCFLCCDNLPPQQQGILLDENHIALCNPRPIFNEHFTVAALGHEEQSLQGRENFFVSLMRQIGPTHAVLFNGAKAGASAPDHFHLQVCPADALPLLKRQAGGAAACWEMTPFCGVKYLLLQEGNSETAVEAVAQLLAALAAEGADPGLLNFIGCWDEGFRIAAVLRAAHRPSCYFEQADRRLIISPAAVEMAGVWVTVRPEDFERADAEILAVIMKEVAADENYLAKLLGRHLKAV